MFQYSVCGVTETHLHLQRCPYAGRVREHWTFSRGREGKGKGKGRGKEGKGKGKGREGAHPCCCLRRTLGCPSMLNYKQLPALLALPVFSWGTEAQVLT